MRHLTEKISIKCHPDWLTRLEAKARQSHLSLSEVVRRAVDGVEIKEPAGKDLHDLVVQLVRLGTLYNQTVRLAHQTRYRTGAIPADAILRELETHGATLELILQAVTANDPSRR